MPKNSHPWKKPFKQEEIKRQKDEGLDLWEPDVIDELPGIITDAMVIENHIF